MNGSKIPPPIVSGQEANRAALPLTVSGQEMSHSPVPPQIDRGLGAYGRDREYGAPGKGDLGAFSQVICTFYIAGRRCRCGL